VALFAIVGGAILFFYAGDPLPLKFVGLGEVAVLIVWGPLMVGGTYYVLARELPAWVIVASLPYALGVTTVLLGKHLDKIDFDRRMRVRTLPVVIGEKRARWLTIAVTALMYLSTLYLVLSGDFLPWLLLAFLALPRANLLYRVYSQPRPAQLPEGYTGGPLWFVAISFLHNRRFGALYIGGLLLHVLTRLLVA
jgi:1,4-dihydroxy-2-naphthoate octaprenyltransferase